VNWVFGLTVGGFFFFFFLGRGHGVWVGRGEYGKWKGHRVMLAINKVCVK
jgi:hypothetical protein